MRRNSCSYYESGEGAMKQGEINLTKTERNLWNAIISEAMALLKYNAYAAKAMEEGHPEIAQIFQETAGAENIHGINHLRTASAIKSTLENLKTVVAWLNDVE